MRLPDVHGTWARWLYAGGRPGPIAKAMNDGWAWLGAHGLGIPRLATLEVVGRTSGKPITFPVMVADLDGSEYLVSMLGEQAQWVKNVRAAGGHAALIRRGRTPVELQEVDVSDRPPIIVRFLDIAPGARPHVAVDRAASLDEVAAVAPTTPVFRIVRSAG